MTELICIRLLDTGFQIRNNPNTLNTFVLLFSRSKSGIITFLWKQRSSILFWGIFSCKHFGDCCVAEIVPWTCQLFLSTLLLQTKLITVYAFLFRIRVLQITPWILSPMYAVYLSAQFVVLWWAAEMKGSLVDSVSQRRHSQHPCSQLKNVAALSVDAKARV